MTTTRTSYSFLLGPVAALVASVAAMAALLLAYDASPARAAGSCLTSGDTTTCTFSQTGEDTFLVPAGVSSVHVEAIGAPGAVGLRGSTAGRGAQVSGDLTGLTAGDTLYVNVGGAPTEVVGTCTTGIACVGGFNGGGGTSFYGGGGGGASDVRTVSRNQDGSLASRLIVAGGGGGSGSGNVTQCSFVQGGSGGDAGSDGGAGDTCNSASGGTGGKAGTQSAEGLGGSPEGQNGSLGLGGDGGNNHGGGGGGGLYGGGGGGDLNARFFSSGGTFFIDFAPAGGGGGGSNLVPSGGNATIASSGPSVTISYTVSTDTTPPTVTTSTPTNKAANVTATFSEEVQNVSPETFFLERRITVKKEPPKYVLVDATVSLINGSYVLDPVEDLPKGEYRATITTAVTDMADNALVKSEVTFTVKK